MGSADACRARWLRQSYKLVTLCCAVLRMAQIGSHKAAALPFNGRKADSPHRASAGQSSSGQAHQLLQTASARLLMVLTDSSLWKCFQPGMNSVVEGYSRCCHSNCRAHCAHARHYKRNSIKSNRLCTSAMTRVLHRDVASRATNTVVQP